MAAMTRVLALLAFCIFIGSSLGRSYLRNDNRIFKRQANGGLCEKPVDLLFVLDSSESVGALNWDKIINFTRKVASKFDVKYTRFGVVQYHSTPEVPIMLSSFKDNVTLDDAISNIYFKPGATRTDLAISKAIDVFKKASCRQASRVAIFIIGARSTDLYVSKGKSINATDLLRGPSEVLQSQHVSVFTVAVSEGLPDTEKLAYKDELNIIASVPPIDHIFESATFDELLSTQVDSVAQKTCLVNGGMSEWSHWSTCSVTCGLGTRVRMRTCNNPKPQNGGLPCTENTVESGECNLRPCPDLENAGPNPGQGGSPWPPSPPQCKPHQTVTHGYPDYYKCGNGFEMITLAPHQLTASSTYSKDSGNSLIKARHAPYNALLNNTQNAGAWCAEHQFAVTQDSTQFLTLDLGEAQLLGKIATQGMAHWDNWVTTFDLKFSSDNIHWMKYERTLQGNCDRHSITENILNPPICARFIKVNPLTWYTAFEPEKHDICMRVGIFKCRDINQVPVSRCRINSQHGHVSN